MRPFLRWTVVLVLAVQAVPHATSLLGGLGHSAFHLAERMARVQADHMARQLEGLAQLSLGFEHSHGPGEETHAHVLPVDLALRFVAAEEEDRDRPGVRAAPQVDRHLPPAGAPDRKVVVVTHPPTVRPSLVRSIPPAPPPVPPPQA